MIARHKQPTPPSQDSLDSLKGFLSTSSSLGEDEEICEGYSALHPIEAAMIRVPFGDTRASPTGYSVRARQSSSSVSGLSNSTSPNYRGDA